MGKSPSLRYRVAANRGTLTFTMFTGIVEALGTVIELRTEGPGKTLVVEESEIAHGQILGASIAVNGVCLTIVALDGPRFNFQVGPETLRLTNLDQLQPGDRVNLERPLKAGDRLGGHIVQGHVDGLGEIQLRHRDGDWEMVHFRCDPALVRYMISKGSVTVDGVSLTIVDVSAEGFSVALIPHTLAATTLGFKKPGDRVNLETDMFGKYIVQYLDKVDFFSPKLRP